VEGCEPHPGTDFLGVDGELIKYIYSAKPPYPLGWPANLMFVQPKAEKTLRQ
jgi:3-(3-hydroxy-phenyl)propionate hydroxylase